MLNIIIAIVGLVVIVGSALLYYASRDDYQRSRLSIVRCAITALAGVGLLLFSISFTIIPTGYTGVRVTFGQINDQVAKNGFNWKLPIVESIKKVNNKQQDVLFEDKIWGRLPSEQRLPTMMSPLPTPLEKINHPGYLLM